MGRRPHLVGQRILDGALVRVPNRTCAWAYQAE
jgi:hypothetical protein